MNDNIFYCYQNKCMVEKRSAIQAKILNESAEGKLWRKAEKLMSQGKDEFDAVLVIEGKLEIWIY